MIITTAMLAPFMVAAAPETPAQTQEPAAVYNWQEQGSVNTLEGKDLEMGLSASSSFMCGQMQIDDWHLC
ncbi:MAG: hypothetical protein Q4F30_08340 [Akkermansia sp.]|nr:hypothetical protein [Akkermansia sp.]